MVDWIESSSDGSKKFEGKILLWIGQPLGPTGDPLRSTQSCCSSIRSLMTACPCVERSTVHPSAYKGFQPNTPHSPHHKNKKKTGAPNKKIRFLLFFRRCFFFRSELLGGVDLSTARSPLRELRERLRPQGARVAGHWGFWGLWVWVEPEVTI